MGSSHRHRRWSPHTDQKGPDMTATAAIPSGVRPRRALLPLASLALAGAALTVSLVAITADDDAPAPAPAAPAAPARSFASYTPGDSATGDCLARAVIVRCRLRRMPGTRPASGPPRVCSPAGRP